MQLTLLPFLIFLSLLSCCIEVDISAPSFPDIATYFGVSDGLVQQTVAYNFLGFCLAGWFYGPLSECYGRRKVMVIGNAFLLIGAVGCTTATSIEWLLTARFIQGIGASASAVVAFAMIMDVYQGDKAVKMIGFMNSAFTTMMAIAPVAGVFINKAIGWRGNYGVVAAVSLLAWVMMWGWLPETKQGQETFNLKKILGDYRKLLTDPRFMCISLAPSLFCAAYMSFVASGSFLYMETFGVNIMAYALHQGTVVGSFAVLSIFSGDITKALGNKICINLGVILSVLGSLGFILLSIINPLSPYLTTSFMVLFAIGFAICYPVLFATSLEIFPEIKGTASAANMSIRTFLCSSFIGMMGYLYDGTPLLVALVIGSAVGLGSLFAIHVLRSGLFSVPAEA